MNSEQKKKRNFSADIFSMVCFEPIHMVEISIGVADPVNFLHSIVFTSIFTRSQRYLYNNDFLTKGTLPFESSHDPAQKQENQFKKLMQVCATQLCMSLIRALRVHSSMLRTWSKISFSLLGQGLVYHQPPFVDRFVLFCL